jgi:hypothetical protein
MLRTTDIRELLDAIAAVLHAMNRPVPVTPPR